MSDSPFPTRVLVCSMNKNTYAHECEEWSMGKNPDTTAPDEHAELYGEQFRIFASNDKAMPGLVFMTILGPDEDDHDRVDVSSYFTGDELRAFRAELDKVIARAEKQEARP